MFHNVKTVLDDFNYSISKNRPFSTIRLGDGGIKLIHAIIFNDERQINEIAEKEGIPKDKIIDILKLWAYSINISNYIDSCQYYFTGNFWSRVRKNKQPMQIDTVQKIMNWKFLYKLAGIKNINYCNPEINFLACLDYLDLSLLDIMKNRKIICVCSNPENLSNVLKDYEINYIKIAGNNENQYNNSFNTVIEKINKAANKYDMWLIAAGELGRIYSGYIKNKNGRAFDVGSLVDYWVSGNLPERLKSFVDPCSKNHLKISLKKEANRYKETI